MPCWEKSAEEVKVALTGQFPVGDSGKQCPERALMRLLRAVLGPLMTNSIARRANIRNLNLRPIWELMPGQI